MNVNLVWMIATKGGGYLTQWSQMPKFTRCRREKRAAVLPLKRKALHYLTRFIENSNGPLYWPGLAQKTWRFRLWISTCSCTTNSKNWDFSMVFLVVYR
jgi:hypothetical protein